MRRENAANATALGARVSPAKLFYKFVIIEVKYSIPLADSSLKNSCLWSDFLFVGIYIDKIINGRSNQIADARGIFLYGYI